MRILGYGEDALTYWALSRHWTDFLVHLNDNSAEQDCLLIYRPSFGRAGGNESAQFGEFDSIVGTRKAVYLIESKWTGEPILDGQVQLAGRQVLRHRIFRWIRERWTNQASPGWHTFFQANADLFKQEFDGKPLAPPGSRLASNFQYFLQQLSHCGAEMKDVLLYFRLQNDRSIPQGVNGQPAFVIVPVVFRPLNLEINGRVIDMQG